MDISVGTEAMEANNRFAAANADVALISMQK
jgi:hypothetical protein